MLSAIEQLLQPAECLVCRRLLSFRLAYRVVCDVCRHRWRPVRAPWCDRCGQPEPHFGSCRLCAAWPEALVRARSAVWLEPEAREVVHALKYAGLGRAADDMADAMARHLARPAPGSVLVPVPLAPRRERRRGYNQSARLASSLGARWEIPVRADLLVRTRETGTQTALTPDARLANVAGAFQMRIEEGGSRIGRPSGQSAIRNPQSPIVLVDDVFTTGATLAECARPFAAAGHARIEAVTFGRAVIPDFT